MIILNISSYLLPVTYYLLPTPIAIAMTKIIQETASMLTRDGIRLDADLYRPDTKEELPILLMRQPDGKEIASKLVNAYLR